MSDINNTLSSDIGGGLESFERNMTSSPEKALSISLANLQLNSSDDDLFEDSLSNLDEEEVEEGEEEMKKGLDGDGRNLNRRVDVDGVVLKEKEGTEEKIDTGKQSEKIAKETLNETLNNDILSFGDEIQLNEYDDNRNDVVAQHEEGGVLDGDEESSKGSVKGVHRVMPSGRLVKKNLISSNGLIRSSKSTTTAKKITSKVSQKVSQRVTHDGVTRSSPESSANTHQLTKKPKASPTQTSNSATKSQSPKELSTITPKQPQSPSIRPIRNLLDYDFVDDSKSKSIGSIGESKKLSDLENENFQLKLKVHLLEKFSDSNTDQSESLRQLQTAISKVAELQTENKNLQDKLVKSNKNDDDRNEYDEYDDNDNGNFNNKNIEYDDRYEYNDRFNQNPYDYYQPDDSSFVSQPPPSLSRPISQPSYHSSHHSSYTEPNRTTNSIAKMVEKLNSENNSIRKALENNQDPFIQISQSPMSDIPHSSFRMLEDILISLTGDNRTIDMVYDRANGRESILNEFLNEISICIENLLFDRENIEQERQQYEESSLNQAQEIESLLVQLTDLKYRFKDLEFTLKDKTNTINSQTNNFKSLQSINIKLTKELQACQNANKKINKEFHDLTAITNGIINSIQSKYDENVTIHSLSEFIDDSFNIISDVQNLSNQVDDLSKHLESKERSIVSLETANKLKDNEIQRIKEEKKLIQSNLSNKDIEYNQLDEKINKLITDNSELQIENNQLTNKLNELSKQNATLSDQLVKKNQSDSIENEKVRTITAQLEEKIQEIFELQNNLKVAEKQLQNVTSKLDNQQANYTDALTSQQDLQLRLSSLQQQLDYSRRDNENLNDKIKGLEESIHFQKSLSDSLEKKLDSGVSGVISGGLQAFKQENYKRAISLQKEVERLVSEKKLDGDKIKFWETKSQESRIASQRLMQTFFQNIAPILDGQEAESVIQEFDNISKDRSKSKFVSMEQLMIEVLGKVKTKVSEIEKTMVLSGDHDGNSTNSTNDSVNGNEISSLPPNDEAKLWKFRYLAMKGKFSAEREARFAEYLSYLDRIKQADDYTKKLSDLVP